MGVRVSLASGDVFWIDCSLAQARSWFSTPDLVDVGGRVVNPNQVTQLTVEQVPSIESPERLKEAV